MHHEALDAFALAFASRKSVSAFTEKVQRRRNSTGEGRWDGAARASFTLRLRVSRVTLSGAARTPCASRQSTSRGDELRGEGEEEGGRESAARFVRAACERFGGNRMQGFGSALGNSRLLTVSCVLSLSAARQSVALRDRERSRLAHPLRSKDVSRRPEDDTKLLPESPKGESQSIPDSQLMPQPEGFAETRVESGIERS